MSIARVSIDSLLKCKERIEEIQEGVCQLQNAILGLQENIQAVKREIESYERLQAKGLEINTKLQEKLSALLEKKRKLEEEIERLENLIKGLESTITALETTIAALTLGLPKTAAKLASVAKRLEEAKTLKNATEITLAERQVELGIVIVKIQKVNMLLLKLSEKQSEISSNLAKLLELNECLLKISTELEETLTKLEQCSRVAIDCIAQSAFYISRYLDISMTDVSYTAPKTVTMRKCLNLEYAGKQYDYRDISDDDSDPRSFIKKKYPDVSFSNIDEFGNTYPDFSKYSKFSYKFPPVTKENLEAGTCLVGDSKTGSADFKKFREAMEAQGYSKREIAELLSTHTIHHHQDGQTMQLIPRDLHEACKHNGGAEKIRLMRAMIGG